MIAGDLALRRRPVAAALDNAAHLATGAALAGLAYAKLGGATGAQALTASNLVPLVAFLVLLPCIVNGTFYISLALGDRKSTRLNSSHGYISYAVFCLKKKKKR